MISGGIVLGNYQSVVLSNPYDYPIAVKGVRRGPSKGVHSNRTGFIFLLKRNHDKWVR
jgi:hypothetical protein